MEFQWTKQQMEGHSRCMLLTNALGGYCSVTDHFAVKRCDQGILIGAVKAPCERQTVVHRLREILRIGTDSLRTRICGSRGSRFQLPGFRFAASAL